MIPNKLMKHLTDKGDTTHIAIFMYLDKLKTFQPGSATNLQPRIHSFDHSIIMTNWQVPGQQQQ
jgi:hypothetical protein